METSLAMGGKSDLVNQSAKSWSGIVGFNQPSSPPPFMNMIRYVSGGGFLREVKIFVPVSYRIDSWKCVKKSIAKVLKSPKECRGSSIYHLVVEPVRLLWKSHKRMESSIKEFEEHQIWKVITWLLGSSPGFPSNFGISEGSLAGIGGQNGACSMGSLVKCDRSGRSNVAKNGSCRLACGYW
jgi:hypothetical protein